MAAPRFHETKVSEIGAASSVIPHPAASSTEPLPSLRDYGLEIADWRTLKDQKSHLPFGVGRIITHLATFSDGSQNKVREVLASNRKFGSDFAYSTPLGTDLDGHNTYVAIQGAREGVDTYIFGPPEEPTSDQHLSHEAQAFSVAMQTIRTDKAEKGKESGTFMIGGYSMAGMKAPAQVHYMNKLGMWVPALNVIDPCLAEEVTWAETKKLMTKAYIGKELLEGHRAIFSRDEGDSLLHAAKRTAHMATSISIHPRYIRRHIRIGKEIWKGEAGTFPQYVPAGTVYAAHFFEDSRFNHFDVYTAAITAHPYGRVLQEAGLHLTAMRRTVIRNYIGQMVSTQKLVEKGAQPDAMAQILYLPLRPQRPTAALAA